MIGELAGMWASVWSDEVGAEPEEYTGQGDPDPVPVDVGSARCQEVFELLVELIGKVMPGEGVRAESRT